MYRYRADDYSIVAVLVCYIYFLLFLSESLVRQRHSAYWLLTGYNKIHSPGALDHHIIYRESMLRRSLQTYIPMCMRPELVLYFEDLLYYTDI